MFWWLIWMTMLIRLLAVWVAFPMECHLQMRGKFICYCYKHCNIIGIFVFWKRITFSNKIVASSNRWSYTYSRFRRLNKLNCTPNGICSPITVPTPPPSPVQINSRVPQPGPHTVSVENINSMSRDQTAAQILPERTWQYCLCGGTLIGDKGNKEDGNWDFVEPTRKASCTCLK